MRMWNVPCELMCRQHLLGEHLEMHMFKGTIQKGKNIDGYLKNKLVDIGNIKNRHDQIVEEMENRGFNHKSPMEKFEDEEYNLTTDPCANLLELSRRCNNCKERIENDNTS